MREEGDRQRWRGLLWCAAWVAAFALAGGGAWAQQRVPADEIRIGHWIDARGELGADGIFRAERAELKPPERHELLIGTVSSYDRRRGRFELLGQPVTLSGDTELENLAPGSLEGRRVEVEGEYRGPDEFEADEIEPRGPGRDRIGGRVDELEWTAEGVVARVMRFAVLLPPTVEQEDPGEAIPLASARVVAARGGVDEDDLFGRGILLAENLRLAGQVQLESGTERNYDLDRGDAEDRRDQEGAVRMRLSWRRSLALHGVAEVRASGRYRDDEDDGTSTTDQLRLGETFLYYRHPRAAFDLQLGRQDFDDEREWLYDRNLDGVRFVKSFFPWQLELSATTTLSDGSRRDRDATNWIAYLARERAERHLAFFVVHRDIDGAPGDRPTHLGFRLLGENGWLDAAWLAGEAAGRDLGGWGLDLGRTFPKAFGPIALTVGYAVGSGGDEEVGGTDRTFRQTGFQDNNGKFDGVTSFRYYGELADPELSNLHVATLGLGARVARRASLDLVAHGYRQDEASEVFLSEIGEDPEGEDRDLGWEIDLVYGDRRWEIFDLEAVLAYFAPGDAFGEDDDALLGKVQVRFRF
ncbi:MAG TPA: alginate export family protein [Planctomycetota bacterium]|nr:alginate export family protein [Planctomycetota bacterium]